MKNLWVIVVVLLSVSSAWAQGAVTPATPPPPAVAPVAPAVPAPVVAAPQTSAPQTPAPQTSAPQTPPMPEVPVILQPNAGDFPPLPPSRPCARPDADGLWKLKNVFEKPRGPTSADFANNPFQYILFLRDDTYRTYKEIWGEKTPDQVKRDLETTPPASIQQFVVHESGMVFFYVDGQNIDTQACFIVVNERGPYAPGQMILMPPEGRIATRLALVYEHALGKPAVTIQSNPEEPYKPRRKPRRNNNK